VTQRIDQLEKQGINWDNPSDEYRALKDEQRQHVNDGADDHLSRRSEMQRRFSEAQAQRRGGT
jgi:hypothetical protein